MPRRRAIAHLARQLQQILRRRRRRIYAKACCRAHLAGVGPGQPRKGVRRAAIAFFRHHQASLDARGLRDSGLGLTLLRHIPKRLKLR